ncbi:MAG TPA: hypothetical protein VMS98_17025 [Thermoanaerobaculia bacterium]|nr:hypothetical protein [Thermoanaerobaculia bacterium]
MPIEVRAGFMVTALLMTPLVLHNATLIDGTGSLPRSGVKIIVDGERIEAISTECAHSAAARVLDVGCKFVVPGFIDMHAHLQERVRDDKGELTPRIDFIEIYGSMPPELARVAENEFGSVQPGRIADLVVLNRNPLERIENTRAIAMVIQRGKVVP